MIHNLEMNFILALERLIYTLWSPCTAALSNWPIPHVRIVILRIASQHGNLLGDSQLFFLNLESIGTYVFPAYHLLVSAASFRLASLILSTDR